MKIRAFVAVGLVVTMTSLGCGWFTANKQTVTTDLGQAASCVLAQVFQGQQDATAIAAACAPTTLADVVALVESLLSFYTQPTEAGPPPAADPAFVARLRFTSQNGRSAMQMQTHAGH